MTLKLYDHLCYFICAQINANGDNERNNIDDDNAESEVDASRSGSGSQVSYLHYLWLVTIQEQIDMQGYMSYFAGRC